MTSRPFNPRHRPEQQRNRPLVESLPHKLMNARSATRAMEHADPQCSGEFAEDGGAAPTIASADKGSPQQ